jgi:hypothetical protein
LFKVQGINKKYEAIQDEKKTKEWERERETITWKNLASYQFSALFAR